MLFVARHQREGAGHIAYALRGLAKIANERDRAGWVALLNIYIRMPSRSRAARVDSVTFIDAMRFSGCRK